MCHVTVLERVVVRGTCDYVATHGDDCVGCGVRGWPGYSPEGPGGVV